LGAPCKDEDTVKVKTYLIKGILLIGVLFAFLYWLDQRTLMKPDVPTADMTENSVERDDPSMTSDSVSDDEASRGASSSGPSIASEESIEEQAMRLAAAASNTEYTRPSNTDTSGFIPDPQGRLSKEQISRYMNILQISMSRLSSESQRLSDSNKALEAQFKQQAAQKTISLASYSHLYFQDMTNMSLSIDKARKIHAEILASKNMSAEEYRWIGERVYQAFYLVANAELKKEHASAKAERIRKIDNITIDEYSEMEKTYLAIFASTMKESGVDMQEGFSKTTLNERFSDYKKSQRDEINRVFEGVYDNPLDNEQIRANGESLQAYKSLFLKARNEYLIIAL
jgi:predicted metal-binding transcription factor (methanogenesis marker protein 9)